MNDNHEGHTEIYITTGELMDMLSVSRSTVYRLIDRGMPFIKVGSVNRFPERQILTWLKEIYGDTSRS